jgi:hypothetical protein
VPRIGEHKESGRLFSHAGLVQEPSNTAHHVYLCLGVLHNAATGTALSFALTCSASLTALLSAPQCVYLPTPIQSPATRSAPQSTLARDWPAAGCMRADVRHRG